MEVEQAKAVTGWIGRQQVKHPLLVLAIALVFTVLIFPGLFKVYFDNDNDNFLPENDPLVDTLFLVDAEFGGNANMQLLFFGGRDPNDASVDLRSPEFLRKSELYAKNLEALGYVVSVDGPAQAVKEANGRVLPNDIETVKRIISSDPHMAAFYNSDFSIMKMTVNLASFPNDDAGQTTRLNELRSSVDSIGLPSGVTFKLWGQFIQFQELNQNQSQNMGLGTILSFILIFGVIVLFYRSVLTGIMAIVPIIIALLWTIGTMGYIDLPFTVLSTGLIPLVMGFGVDYSIHLTHSIRHLRQEGKKMEDAIMMTMEDVGESLLGASTTTAIGFLSLTLASLLVTQRLGLTLAMATVYVFFSCIVIVPPVLLLKERIFKTKANENR